MGDLLLGFNVTLDGFCGWSLGTFVVSMRENPDVGTTWNGAGRRAEKNPASSLKSAPCRGDLDPI